MQWSADFRATEQFNIFAKGFSNDKVRSEMLKQGIACFQEDFFLIMVTKTLSPLLVVFCLKGFTE
jgi:hypothetical protein